MRLRLPRKQKKKEHNSFSVEGELPFRVQKEGNLDRCAERRGAITHE